MEEQSPRYLVQNQPHTEVYFSDMGECWYTAEEYWYYDDALVGMLEYHAGCKADLCCTYRAVRIYDTVDHAEMCRLEIKTR